MSNSKQYWDNIYIDKKDNEVSWFQENPITSLNLIKKYSSNNKDLSKIDVDGGNSMLTAQLVKNGYSKLYVLDISKKALDRSQERIPNAPIVWIESNILDCDSIKDINIWHDRAVFHFLTKEEDIKKYVALAKNSVIKNGYLILSTFSESGPEKFSGLPITQYTEIKFRNLFESTFELQECFEEEHNTPFNTQQDFIWIVFKKI
jgi:hypothetical protein